MGQTDLLNSPQAQALLKHKEQVMGLADSPDAKRLMELLSRAGGAGLEDAAQAAVKGEPQALIRLMQSVLSTPEGAKTVQNISRELPK